MNRVKLPGLPARRAADFELDQFTPPRYARVIYTPVESRPDRRVIEAQAFEVDAQGRLVPAPNGAASRTPGTQHTIDVTGLGDTHTLVPGWVRVVGNFDPTKAAGEPTALPEGTVIADELPETDDGKTYWVRDRLYRWNEGLLETIMRGKAEELAGLLRNSAALGEFEL